VGAELSPGGFLADLHIHSRFSRATSRSLSLPTLHQVAQLKGLRVIGSGDVTHPAWRAELAEQLVPAEPGLFALRPELALHEELVPSSCRGPVRFLLAGEISNIYKRDGRTRKVHNLVCLPSFEALDRLVQRLERIGNLRSDGRPILGLDSRDLLEIVLETDPDSFLIPAHVWTPWFSALGSKSGFDSIDACYGDLAEHVFSVETGLSSDPPMNWRVSSLQRFTLVSCSDAHSPSRLGREATRFHCDLGYPQLLAALRGGAGAGYGGTLEFYPEQGKYHLDGHRSCGVRLEPTETRALGGRCPECGRPLTVGVLHRVEELADRPAGHRPRAAAPFDCLVGLADLVGELLGRGSATKGVQRVCDSLRTRLGPELRILQETPREDLRRAGSDLLAEAVVRAREGRVRREAGFDGEYGRIRVLADNELERGDGQLALAGLGVSPGPGKRRTPSTHRAGAFSQKATGVDAQPTDSTPTAAADESSHGTATDQAAHEQTAPGHEASSLLASLDADQALVLGAFEVPALLVVAGPGTGKTRTLSHAIAWGIRERGVDPRAVVAVTFTQQAGAELAARLAGLLDGQARAAGVRVGTFHALCHDLLRRHHAAAQLPPDFTVLDADQALATFKAVASGHDLLPPNGQRGLAGDWARLARRRAAGGAPSGRSGDRSERVEQLWLAYRQHLAGLGVVDFDGLLERAADLLSGDLLLRHAEVAPLRLVAVDEYQDVNARQETLLRLLTSGGARLVAIGDPDQAIYGFRGADPGHLLGFERRWPGSRRVRLTRSYRASAAILKASHQALGSAASTAEALRSERAGDPHITVAAAPTERAEAEQVVHAVERAVGGTGFFSLDSGRSRGEVSSCSFGDVAVLYRTHSQAAPLVEAFARSGIPFQLTAPSRAHHAMGPRALRAALWACRHRGPATLAVLADAAQALAPLPAAGDAAPSAPIAPSLLEALVDNAATVALVDLPAHLAAGLTTATGAPPETAEALGAAAGEIRAKLAEGVPLGVLLSEWALLREADWRDPRAERVSLMSLHACKGLEFDLVFVVGCEEGLIPFRPPWRDPESVDVAEERRLLYVGMTRARRRLVLSHAARRSGAWPVEREPSPFLHDIAAQLKRAAERHEQRRQPEPEPQPQLRLL